MLTLACAALIPLAYLITIDIVLVLGCSSTGRTVGGVFWGRVRCAAFSCARKRSRIRLSCSHSIMLVIYTCILEGSSTVDFLLENSRGAVSPFFHTAHLCVNPGWERSQPQNDRPVQNITLVERWSRRNGRGSDNARPKRRANHGVVMSMNSSGVGCCGRSVST